MKDLVTYVLVRTDLPSLNTGKALAQSHHAGVQLLSKHAEKPLVREYIEAGMSEGADFFNTTLTLAAKFSDIEHSISLAKNLDCVCDIVIDPSYPFLVDIELDPFLKSVTELTRVKQVSDSQVLYTRRELTCAYALGDRNDPEFASIFSDLSLLK